MRPKQIFPDITLLDQVNRENSWCNSLDTIKLSLIMHGKLMMFVMIIEVFSRNSCPVALTHASGPV